VDDEPGDDVLLELGRVVWAALQLEDVVYAVCRSVRPRHGPSDDHPIGSRIDEALRDLAQRPDNELRVDAYDWLVAAKAALIERNAVLHSAPYSVVTADDDSDPFLLHLPRDKSGAVVTALTVDALSSIRGRIEAARQGWSALAVALWEHRSEVT
jgi:hypothetical protein